MRIRDRLPPFPLRIWLALWAGCLWAGCVHNPEGEDWWPSGTVTTAAGFPSLATRVCAIQGAFVVCGGTMNDESFQLRVPVSIRHEAYEVCAYDGNEDGVDYPPACETVPPYTPAPFLALRFRLEEGP